MYSPTLISPQALGKPVATHGYEFADAERIREAARAMTQSAVFACTIFLAFTFWVDAAQVYLPFSGVAGFAGACLLMRTGYHDLGKFLSFSTAAILVAAIIGAYGTDTQSHLLVAPVMLAGYTCFKRRLSKAIALTVGASIFVACVFEWLNFIFPVLPRNQHMDLFFVLVTMVISYWMVDDLLCVNREFRVRSRAAVAELELRHAQLDQAAEAMREQSEQVQLANGALSREIAHGQCIQRQLRASNEQLEQFVYAASHDLKEPLRSISGFLQLIRRKLRDQGDAELQEYFEFVLSSSARMTRLLDGLLTYSRASKMDLEFEMLDLDRMLVLVQTDLRSAISKTGAQIQVAQPLGQVFCVKRAVQDMLREVLDNAIKFSKPGEVPQIEIAATKQAGGGLLLSISDRGIGVETEFHEQIFQLFQRLQLVDNYDGAGIGLALVRKLAHAVGAQVRVSSPASGLGLCVELLLPAQIPSLPESNVALPEASTVATELLISSLLVR